jgi:AcrR family transcriptional regulator
VIISESRFPEYAKIEERGTNMPVNQNDPRVKRTRQLIMQSFTDLVEEKKNVYSISVEDITTRATVNRATFYAHFEDKFAFLECWMGEKFQKI